MQSTPRHSPAPWALALLAGASALALAAAPAPEPERVPTAFIPLRLLPAPRVVDSAVAYPGGRYAAGNLVDGDARTEYSSDARGTNTFVVFDFGVPVALAAFRHQDRNDPATVAASELVALDDAGRPSAPLPATHVNMRAGVTFHVLPSPVTTRRVRWRPTVLGTSHTTVGGAEVSFYAAGEPEAAPRNIRISSRAFPILQRGKAALTQPVQVTLDYPYATPVPARLRLAGREPVSMMLTPGEHVLRADLPSVSQPVDASASVDIAGRVVATHTFTRKPIRKWEIHILPHSHVDIGYTALQADVAAKQNRNIDRALELIRATRDYPLDARFKWNVEVLWPVDNYLQAATAEARAAFMAAVRQGRIGLDALYGNLLTGLCRPEELVRSATYATRLARQSGIPISSAMISDVPGYTWSTVTALAEAGVKYFSFAPNYFDRMGRTMVTWPDKPFWWIGADGVSKLLCWCPPKGYALGHLLGEAPALERYLPDYLRELEDGGYPFDLAYLRWSVHGDNGPPDETLADFVRDWNLRHATPHLVISTTREVFEKLEQRHGDRLPKFAGDYTPYWEDGAASSARETALNRASAERLVQAETLWALRSPGAFPARDFDDAWRQVLLYSEHTWGAHNSVSQPDLDFVTQQWHVKQAFALDADRQSRNLLARALGQEQPGTPPAAPDAGPPALHVFNTCAWKRTDLVTLPPDLSAEGDRVTDARGNPVPSQRLSTGALAFLAENVPPLAAASFRVEAGPAPARGEARAEGVILRHPAFTLRLDEHTGAIRSFTSRVARAELVDAEAPTALNDYFYLPGADLARLQRNGPPRISVQDPGPLVASLRVESDAPGCRKLIREVRVVDGLDFVEIRNTVDKLPVRAKEGLHFGYGFNVPGGTVRLDVGWAVVRPNVDQLPAACKNWFSVQRWVDIANEHYGVTWTTLDAPLLEVGGVTANLVGSQTNPDAWIRELPSSRTIYSWVMNNHWHTNYRAEQEGAAVFRYGLLPHRAYNPVAAARFGLDRSQPLRVARAAGYASPTPRLKISSDQVAITAFKPANDGQAWILRLFGASGETRKVRLAWPDAKPRHVWFSDTSEEARGEAPRAIPVPGWGLVTLRVEF
ncbi:MAG: hypothetical protein JXQ71_07325 [Verrucomicrobia bacterium]|nr:hypothetical protein [Verrucomicrobiota bacterium]